MAQSWLDYLKGLDYNGIGTGAAGYANAQARSRSAGEQMEMDREVLRQSGEDQYVNSLDAREKARQDSAASAYKRLLQYDHINAGGTHGLSLTPYDRPIEAPGANAKRLASDEGIVNELHQRASFGDPYFPGSPGLTDSIFARQRMPGSDNPGDVYGRMEQYMKAGAGEKTMGWLGALAPFLKNIPWPGGGKPDPNKDKTTTPTGGTATSGGAGGTLPDNFPTVPFQEPPPPGAVNQPGGVVSTDLWDWVAYPGGPASWDWDTYPQGPPPTPNRQ